MQTLKAAAIQMTSIADVAVNLAAAGRLLRQAAQAGATLAVLPENFAFMGARERDKLAHGEPAGSGIIQQFLCDTARALSLHIVAGTIPLKMPDDEHRVFATSLLIDSKGEVTARYDKIHLFDVDTPGGERYRESNSIGYGAPQITVAQAAMASVGFSVCYDLRFPELYRGLAKAGADLITVPSAFTEKTGEAHWEILLRARAVENQCYVIAPNQSGSHPGERRTWGHSMIVDPWGVILAQRLEEGEGVVIAELDGARLDALRKSFPVLTHRRL